MRVNEEVRRSSWGVAGREGLLRRLLHHVDRGYLVRELLADRVHQVIERVRSFVFDAIDEERRRTVRATSHCALQISVHALEAMGAAVASGIALLVVTHPNALTAYAATHTTAVVAAIGIGAASVMLSYGVALEADRP